MPLDRSRLLEPEELAARLDDERLLVVDVGSPDRYDRAHIPGAVLVTPPELVDGTPPASGRLPTEDRLEALFARLGYTPDLRFVVYDDEGGGWAGRFAWTLEAVGHRDWAYLNGGLHAWHAAGQPLAVEPAVRTPRVPSLQIDRSVIAEAEDVLAAMDDTASVIWDARSPAEYRGEKVAARHAGHVPGAVNLDWLELMDRSRALRLREDLDTLLAEHGITPEKRIVTHCQSHHRSGLTWMVGRLLGHPEVRGYHGSWGEWGNRDDLPVRTGAEP